MKKPITIVLAVTMIAVASAVFAAGNAVRGQQLYESRCIDCHSVDQSRVGPAHRGVCGRRAGRVADCNYSAALKGSRVIWSEKTLNAWLENPERMIPGQKMGFQLTEALDRVDLIACLKEISPHEH